MYCSWKRWECFADLRWLLTMWRCILHLITKGSLGYLSSPRINIFGFSTGTLPEFFAFKYWGRALPHPQRVPFKRFASDIFPKCLEGGSFDAFSIRMRLVPATFFPQCCKVLQEGPARISRMCFEVSYTAPQERSKHRRRVFSKCLSRVLQNRFLPFSFSPCNPLNPSLHPTTLFLFHLPFVLLCLLSSIQIQHGVSKCPSLLYIIYQVLFTRQWTRNTGRKGWNAMRPQIFSTSLDLIPLPSFSLYVSSLWWFFPSLGM